MEKDYHKNVDKKIIKTSKIKIIESTIIEGNSYDMLRLLPSKSVQCVITSPPYWGLRDYNISGQIGVNETLSQYIAILVTIFSEVARVLRDDGVLWLNIGDSYSSGNRTWRAPDPKCSAREMSKRQKTPEGLKPKDLIGVPWKLAFALQESGWYLRSDIIWHKPNAMPESVKDRPTRSHEYIFLFSKKDNYYFDSNAIMEEGQKQLRNKRSVWSIRVGPNIKGHVATFPTSLVEPCVLAGSRPGDFILDPFFGSGTVGLVCKEQKRKYIGIELNPLYVELAARRIGIAKKRVLKPTEFTKLS